MTQKELNYIEDLYNHELMLKNVLLSSLESTDDKEFEKVINNQIGEHDKIIDNIIKLLEGEC